MPGAPPLPGSLPQRLIGDLAPAIRLLDHIKRGTMPPTPGVLEDIEAAIERCVERIQTEVR